MTSFDVDRRIEALARRQHGVFNRTQALQAGASSSLIDRRLASGAWVLLDPSVYALRSHPFSFLRQCWAATLSMPGAVVAGSTAAAIWGFTGYRPGGIEIAVTPTISARSRIATVHRLSGALVTAKDGLPITTMAQTLFDVARPSSMVRLERALDDLLAARRITLEPLEERLAFYEATRRPGLPKIRALILERQDDAWEPPESELERILHRVLRRLPGRPEIVRQHRFPWRDAAPGRVDVWIPAYNVLVEADGRRWHTRVRDFDRDRWRDNLAVAHGVRPLRFTWAHLVTQPDEVIALILQAAELARPA